MNVKKLLGEKNVGQFNFMQALAHMEKGQAVKRDVWTIEQGYRMVLPGSKHVYMIVNAHTAPQVQWAPISLEDFNAHDWRLVNDADLSPLTEIAISTLDEITTDTAA